MTASLPSPVQVKLFTSVLQCQLCPSGCVLRDAADNVPQPGWVGRRFDRGVLFIGQNPGERRSGSVQLTADIEYIEALRQVKDAGSLSNLLNVMHRSMQAFVMYRQYIPTHLFENVAIINTVRCRTVNNSAPPQTAIANCRKHLEAWLDALEPRAVVFNGVWARRTLGSLIEGRGLPFETINRQRSLSRHERRSQEARVVALVRRESKPP